MLRCFAQLRFLIGAMLFSLLFVVAVPRAAFADERSAPQYAYAQSGGTIAAMVWDLHNGEPLVGVRYWIWGVSANGVCKFVMREGKSGVGGYFEESGLPDGRYVVVVHTQSYMAMEDDRFPSYVYRTYGHWGRDLGLEMEGIVFHVAQGPIDIRGGARIDNVYFALWGHPWDQPLPPLPPFPPRYLFFQDPESYDDALARFIGGGE